MEDKNKDKNDFLEGAIFIIITIAIVIVIYCTAPIIYEKIGEKMSEMEKYFTSFR